MNKRQELAQLGGPVGFGGGGTGKRGWSQAEGSVLRLVPRNTGVPL